MGNICPLTILVLSQVANHGRHGGRFDLHSGGQRLYCSVACILLYQENGLQVFLFRSRKVFLHLV